MTVRVNPKQLHHTQIATPNCKTFRTVILHASQSLCIWLVIGFESLLQIRCSDTKWQAELFSRKAFWMNRQCCSGLRTNTFHIAIPYHTNSTSSTTCCMWPMIAFEHNQAWILMIWHACKCDMIMRQALGKLTSDDGMMYVPLHLHLDQHHVPAASPRCPNSFVPQHDVGATTTAITQHVCSELTSCNNWGRANAMSLTCTLRNMHNMLGNWGCTHDHDTVIQLMAVLHCSD